MRAIAGHRRSVGEYDAVIMETHRARHGDVIVIVHGQSDGLVRTLHALCRTALRQVLDREQVAHDAPATDRQPWHSTDKPQCNPHWPRN